MNLARQGCGEGGGIDVKRSGLIIVIILSVLLLSSCASDKTGLGGNWKVDFPDENDLRLGAASNKGEIKRIIYHLSRPDWFSEGDLAIVYEFSGTSERDWYDVGYYSVKGNHINLMGTGSYIIEDGVLTICYDDGTVRTFTRTQLD